MQNLAVFDEYLRGLRPRHGDRVVAEMEREADRSDFPIVGPLVGVVLEILARSIEAKRVFEMGSGFGYSAYWFSRAIGAGGELHLTDGDAAYERKAMDYLGRAGLDGPVRFHVGEAVQIFQATTGEFDVVFCDIDKDGYPKAWQAARDRVRVGGLYICDNALGFGDVSILSEHEGRRGKLVQAIREHNQAVFSDAKYLSTILPIRDGVLVALRTT